MTEGTQIPVPVLRLARYLYDHLETSSLSLNEQLQAIEIVKWWTEATHAPVPKGHTFTFGLWPPCSRESLESLERLEAASPAQPDQEPMPIFTIRTPGREIRIYANGVVEGIDESYRIVNYIPFAIRLEAIKRFSKRYKLPYTGEGGKYESGSSEGASDATPLMGVIMSREIDEATGEK